MPAVAAIHPHLGRGMVTGAKHTSAYDLVEEMCYLYVHVNMAKDLAGKDVSGSFGPCVEVKLGDYKGTTRRLAKKSNPEWNQVFAFGSDRIQSAVLEITAKNTNCTTDDFMGRVIFNTKEIPKRVPPDSPSAPQWYGLEDRKREKVRGELMLAVWMGTQADEAFPEAWDSDWEGVSGTDVLSSLPSKVYYSPEIWYLRVNVIEAQDLQPSDKGRFPETFVEAILGNQVLRTRNSQSGTTNPVWNEDLMFVAAKPFEEPLILRVEERLSPSKGELLGRYEIPLQDVDMRFDHKPVNARWYDLEKHVIVEGEQKKEIKVPGKIHMRICLEGGYHVLDESTHHISDLRPTAKELWKSSIGVLELGILNAQGLMPMKTKDGRGTTDAYCVAKYGHKWVRTRTIIDSLRPKWNEQYAWEVFDPCTVVTIGVFDNCHLHGGDGKYGRARDSRIGKVRIRISTLETGRVYKHEYPLMVLHSSGLKKMGEIHLAVKFSCSSLLRMMHMYSQRLLPKMHYVHPISPTQLDSLRSRAIQVIFMRLSVDEPPLQKEVLEYMLDQGSQMWSLRRINANFSRIRGILHELFAFIKWFDQICNWEKPVTTVFVHVLFIILVMYPEIILPAFLLYLFFIMLRYRIGRPGHPSELGNHILHEDPDILDEEFDAFPTSRPSGIVRMRYDRLRITAGELQNTLGDLAIHGERLQALLNWHDPRATSLFAIFCLSAAIILHITPFRVVALLAGFYMLRHPMFRDKLPSFSVLLNFFGRLPSKTLCLL
ncbi:hypothetical protein F2P56_024489 [Juglans regia]|uniref:FT-interacting protein 3-like n=2 Tax=Juglans regia TaxID=51240 RepID=A0A2I4HSF2_JUGRE|nr:FT-interacting protein 3-like [Juglans regia]KAF5454855.1 hypothetical protein F2P56_024489 [Juglans regia]